MLWCRHSKAFLVERREARRRFGLVFPQQAVDRGRGHAGQNRRLLGQGVELVAVQYAATREQADDPMGSRFADGLDVFIFEVGGRNEHGKLVVGFVCINPVEL